MRDRTNFACAHGQNEDPLTLSIISCAVSEVLAWRGVSEKREGHYRTRCEPGRMRCETPTLLETGAASQSVRSVFYRTSSATVMSWGEDDKRAMRIRSHRRQRSGLDEERSFLVFFLCASSGAYDERRYERMPFCITTPPPPGRRRRESHRTCRECKTPFRTAGVALRCRRGCRGTFSAPTALETERILICPLFVRVRATTAKRRSLPPLLLLTLPPVLVLELQ